MTSAMTFAEFDLSVFGVSKERSLAPVLDLPSRLRQGDIEAVAEAYDKFAGSVRAFAKRLIGDTEAAEDLVHDVFVTLPSAIRNFRGESSFKTFLISIAVNHARHHLRAAARPCSVTRNNPKPAATIQSICCGGANWRNSFPLRWTNCPSINASHSYSAMWRSVPPRR